MTKLAIILSAIILLPFTSGFICKGDENKKDTTIVTLLDTSKSKEQKDTLQPKNTFKQPSEDEKRDTIIKKNGFAIVCKVVYKNLFEIQYVKQNEKLVRKISTADLKEIHYSSGKFDLIDNNPEKREKDWVTPMSEKDWAKVKVFTDPTAVEGLIEKGPIENEYISKKMNTENDVMERTTLIVLQRKACTMKACAILIVSKDFIHEYGELPSVRIKAIAYGKE